jgi:CDP-4-dehydro-6-deoxyglucose reductase
MTNQVTLQPSGHTFEVSGDEYVLTAGLNAGYNLPYSCRVGMCSTCRAKLIEGSVELSDHFAHVLTPEMQAENLVLLCRAIAQTDLVVEVQELSLEAIKPRVVPCRVMKIARVAPDIAIMDLRLPQNDNMRFAAGQYVEILLPGGKRRAYSIANAPRAEGVIDVQIHVRHTVGGLFTDRVFSTMKEREVLRFEGPLGTFCLREDSDRPVVLVASGTGFAPIKSMIEHAITRRMTRPIALYWGCRTRADLYMHELAESWAQTLPHVTYVPVLSDERGAWSGRTGLVHRAVLDDFASLSGHEAYVCGNPLMVNAARDTFTRERGLPARSFFADAFLTEADRAAGTHVTATTVGEPAHA